MRVPLEIHGLNVTNRRNSVTQKIAREVTGLNGALFVHITFDHNSLPVEISISAKGKDDSTLDKILTAIGETATSIIQNRGTE